MNIYIIKRKDGTYWADVNERILRYGVQMNILQPVTRGDFEALVKGPNDFCDARIRALAERMLDEHIESLRPYIPAPLEKTYRKRETVAVVAKKTFWQRLIEVFRG